MARAEGIHIDLDAESNFVRQAALAEGFKKRKTSKYWPDWVRGRGCHHDHPLTVGAPYLVCFAAVRLPSSGSFAARLCAGFLYNDASRVKKSSEN